MIRGRSKASTKHEPHLRGEAWKINVSMDTIVQALLPADTPLNDQPITLLENQWCKKSFAVARTLMLQQPTAKIFLYIKCWQRFLVNHSCQKCITHIFSYQKFLSDLKRNLHDASISSMKRLASCSPSISVEDENQQNETSNISATFLRYSTEVMESDVKWTSRLIKQEQLWR